MPVCVCVCVCRACFVYTACSYPIISFIVLHMQAAEGLVLKQGPALLDSKPVTAFYEQEKGIISIMVNLHANTHTNIMVHWYEQCWLIWGLWTVLSGSAWQSNLGSEKKFAWTQQRFLSKPQNWHEPDVRLFYQHPGKILNESGSHKANRKCNAGLNLSLNSSWKLASFWHTKERDWAKAAWGYTTHTPAA